LYINFIHYKIEKLKWDALPRLTFQKMSFTSDKARDGIGDAGDGEGGVGNGVVA
jgi:hypothetical protein